MRMQRSEWRSLIASMETPPSSCSLESVESRESTFRFPLVLLRNQKKKYIAWQTSQNFLNQHVNQSSVFGPPGQVFLYEWSKFRYGVFEEHGYPGDPLYPMFYSKQIFTAQGARNVVKPNLCTNVEPTGLIIHLIMHWQLDSMINIRQYGNIIWRNLWVQQWRWNAIWWLHLCCWWPILNWVLSYGSPLPGW